MKEPYFKYISPATWCLSHISPVGEALENMENWCQSVKVCHCLLTNSQSKDKEEKKRHFCETSEQNKERGKRLGEKLFTNLTYALERTLNICTELKTAVKQNPTENGVTEIEQLIVVYQESIIWLVSQLNNCIHETAIQITLSA